MKAVRVHAFGGLDEIRLEEIARPMPEAGQVLVRVRAAGVGPWDALIRSGQSGIPQPLPLTLGSDISGIVEEVGSDVTAFSVGEEVFGVTNERFTGGYAEYALAEADMIARKPKPNGFVDAASVPVVAVTAWQMVFDRGQVEPGKRVLVHGAAGSVGSYAVQLAKHAGAEVIAVTTTRNRDYVASLRPDRILDLQAERFEEQVQEVDVVIDTIGGEIQERSFATLKPGGVLVSVVAPPNPELAAQHGVEGVFFIVRVTTEVLERIADLLAAGQLKTHVGTVLPLVEARLAHEMLAGKPHPAGKIVLRP